MDRSAADPFHPGDVDAALTCTIVASELVSKVSPEPSTTPILTNACSFSGGTYSFPQDCIAQTILGVGLLTVIKDVGSEVTSDAFQLTLSPASLDGRTDLSIIGGQTITRIPVNADLDHTLTEAAPPPGWEFGSIDCLLNGTTTGTTVGQSRSGIAVEPGQETVCTIHNLRPSAPPAIQVSKTAVPIVVPESGGDVTFTFTVHNPNAYAVSITRLYDSVYGDLSAAGSCPVGSTLQAGATCTLSITRSLSGPPGTDHVNTVEVRARTSWGATTGLATATATVTFVSTSSTTTTSTSSTTAISSSSTSTGSTTTTPSSPPTASSDLPQTGADVGRMVAMAGVLIVLGLGLLTARRRTGRGRYQA